jgi:membrane-associated phospholipid phosphatase
MLPVERLVIAYLAFFAVAAPFARVERRRRARTAAIAASCAIAVYGVSQTLPMGARLCLPFLYFVLGYWIPVPLVPSGRGGAFEMWLRHSDEALRRRAVRLPRWLAETLELGYLACFPMVPAAFAVVWTTGSQAEVAKFWLAVIAAGYACYISLPWLVSRPSRSVDVVAERVPPSMSRANVFVLGWVSHQLNTFPSGHVAVSVAAAIAAGTVSPFAGMVLGLLATGVALGAVAGRYHYIVDVALGAGIGVLVNVV